MKKMLSIILLICMVVSNVVVLAEEDYAEIVFGGKSINIDSCTYPGGVNVTRNGKKGLLMTTTGGNEYIRVNVADSFIYSPEGEQPVIISVEYFDSGYGSFTITYDGLHNKQYYDTSQTNAETVQLENSGTWKTHEFYFDDIKFANSYWYGLDFRIGLWANEMKMSNGDVCFGNVRIEKTYAREPIKSDIKSDFMGHIFGPDDEKNLELEIKNVSSEEVKVKYTYRILNETNELVDEKEFEKILSEKQTITEQVDMTKVEKFGIYTLKTSVIFERIIDGQVQSGTTENSFEFSLINKPREKNKKQYASVHLWQGLDNTVEIADYAGLGGVREELEWNDVESEKGILKVPENSDTFVNKVIDKGMDYLILCAFGNQYYDNASVYNRVLAPYTDEGIEAYARYCKYLAEKYKGKVKAFEIWNEYNIPAFNAREDGGEVYVKMLKAANKAIKEVIPDAIIVGVCTAGTDPEFMREVLEAGGYDYMDVVSCHPYDWGGSFRLPYYIERVREIQNLFKEYGGEKPIWFTELGISSADCISGTSEEMQAAYAIQMYVVSQGENLAERTYWYNLQDCGTDQTNGEHKFGLVNSQSAEQPHTAKPAMVSISGMNSFLNNAYPKDSIKINDDIYAYLFEKANGEQIAVMWSVSSEGTLGVDFGCDEIEMFDMYTNSLGRVNGDNGEYSFILKPEPVYIKGDFKCFKKTNCNITQSISKTTMVAGDTVEVDFYDKIGRDLSVEIEAPAGVRVVENTGIEHGNGKIFLTAADNDKTYRIKVYIKNGEKVVSISDIWIDIVEAIDVEVIGTSQIANSDTEHWQVEVKIRNNSRQQTISGVCETTDEENKDYSKPAKFFGLKPEEDITLYINLPSMVKKRLKDVNFKVSTDTGAEKEIMEELDFTAAKYTEEAPVIDGKIEPKEWKGMWLTADEKKYVKEKPEWSGPSDISYDCNIMWNSEYFYLAAIVTDDIFYQKETADRLWSADSLQFALKNYDSELIVDGNNVDKDFSEFGIALLPTGAEIYRFKTMYSELSEGIVENKKVSITRNGDKTIYEIAIPWSEIFYSGFKPEKNTDLGFSLLVNDNDGTGRGWLEYKDGIGGSKNALLFGTLHLAE